MSLDLLKEFAEKPSSPWGEIVVERSGDVRQAGADGTGDFLRELRATARRSLFFFAFAIVGRKYLTSHLHLPTCEWLQQRIPYRKMLLYPRDHAKTSMVSHCLPPHILIQDAKTNCYFPGHPGSDSRIMLACETEDRAAKHIRVVQTLFESNKLFRACFPECCWEGSPRREAKKWNELEMILPREHEYPEPNLFGVGVGKAVTGSRPNVMIKDDLISLAARNSEAVMSTAIEWHIASRALLDEYEESSGLQSLEFIIGTRWAIFDLYQYIIDEDPSVEVRTRAIVEDGRPIWPERFSMDGIAQLKREFRSLFSLLYMNDAANPELVSFDVDGQLRYFEVRDGMIVFREAAEDLQLAKRWEEQPTGLPEGMKLTTKLQETFFTKGRLQGLRLRSG